ncbi:bL33 family ribosomal protein, partial [Bacillus pumilus]
KKTNPHPLDLKKYSPPLNKYTLHTQTK